MSGGLSTTGDGMRLTRGASVSRRSAREWWVSPSPLVAVAVAAAVTFAVVVGWWWQGVSGLLLVLAPSVVLGLLLVRMWARSRRYQERLGRDSAFRRAMVDLTHLATPAEVRDQTLAAACELVGPDLRFAAWVAFGEGESASLVELRGPRGEPAVAETDIDAVLPHVDRLATGTLGLRDGTGAVVLILPMLARLARPATLVVGLKAEPPSDLGPVLTALALQSGLALDASQRAGTARARWSDARFEQLVHHSGDAVLVVARDGRVSYQSPSVVRVLGYLTVDLDGAPLERIAHPDEAGHLDGFLDQLVRSPDESVRTVDAQLLRADDSSIYAEIVGVNLLSNPQVSGIALTIRDVSRRRILEDQLRHQAFHDPLTGLANRALFSDRVAHGLDRVRRSESPTPAVAFLDLDEFKLVNDRLGHGAGDELLRVVADRLRSCLRAGDTPARLGGDEFAILVEDAPDVASIVEVVERVLVALDAPMVIEGEEVYARASIGIATRQDENTTVDDLLRNADLAMYAAKAKGKARIELYDAAMRHKAGDRLAIRDDLQKAVVEETIEVAYQPIVRLAGGELVGFEALARWNHPERGPVSPVEFLAIADNAGVIIPLGHIILRRACEQLGVWLSANPDRSLQMGVNLSARQLLAPDLVEVVRELTTQAEILPSSLVLELAESVLLADTESVLRRLHELKALGVKIAIDDFGTGHSSLSYLQRVPFDILKIDRTCVAALRHDDPESSLVRTIMDLGRTLGRTVVAEGVEEQAELDGLLALGCELGQGYRFGRPATAESLGRSLALQPPRHNAGAL